MVNMIYSGKYSVRNGEHNEYWQMFLLQRYAHWRSATRIVVVLSSWQPALWYLYPLDQMNKFDWLPLFTTVCLIIRDKLNHCTGNWRRHIWYRTIMEKNWRYVIISYKKPSVTLWSNRSEHIILNIQVLSEASSARLKSSMFWVGL